MNGILALCIQDIKRMRSNALFWVISVTLIVIILVVNFALPKELGAGEMAIYSYNAPAYGQQTIVLSSEAELREQVSKGGAIGIIGGENQGIRVIHTGFSEQAIQSILQALQGGGQLLQVETIKEQGAALPFHKRMTPVFICFEALIVGFILGGTLLLSEKEENTSKAIRVSPISVHRYLLSKTLLFGLIGTLYASLMTLFTVGAGFHWLEFLLLSFIGSALFTLMGLGFTAPFRDMSSWFFSASLLLSLNMFTAVSYSNPSFAPLAMRWIPSYPLLFSYADILFGDGLKFSTLLWLITWCLILYGLALILCKRFLYEKKGGRV